MTDLLTKALSNLTDAALALEMPDQTDALILLTGEDARILEVVSSACYFRKKYFSNLVKLNYLVNIKSGFCQEDCSYCSQAKHSEADILRYPFIDTELLMKEVERGITSGAARICLVASGRGPTERDITKISAMVKEVKAAYPAVEICTSLGILAEEHARQLKSAGVFAYNHNLNTSSEHYSKICSTHTYQDRQETVQKAKTSGLSPCSGALFGMGESDNDIVSLAEGLYAADPESVPVNFLLPFDGTPLSGFTALTPGRCLRILSLMRFYFPNKEIRAGAGRETHLRSMQVLSLHVVNSLFVGDYLTSTGQPGEADIEMIRDAGFIPITPGGTENGTAGRPGIKSVKVESRKRGPGSKQIPNK